MIPDDLIHTWLSSLFGKSEPGDSIHSLVIVTERLADISPLGMVADPDKLTSALWTLAPDKTVDGMVFANNAIAKAIVDAKEKDQRIVFAALAMELNAVVYDQPGPIPEHEIQMAREHRLAEHPEHVEVTRLYAACRDGRRWTGSHWLTGPRAGRIKGPSVLTGPLTPQESGSNARLLRHAVGI